MESKLHPTPPSTELACEPRVQAPPDVKIAICTTVNGNKVTIIRMVALGDKTIGKYQANKEYWRHAGLNNIDFDKIELGAATIKDNSGNLPPESEINSLFNGFNASFDCTRNVSESDWSKNNRRTPDSGRTWKLLSMADPDDAGGTRKLGVLLEMKDNSLVAVSWYKFAYPTNGLVWSGAAVSTRDLTVVKDNGNPTSDPTKIQTGDYWRITMSA